MALDRGDCPTIAYASQARRAPSSCVLLLLYMSMFVLGPPCSSRTAGLSWSGPRHRRTLAPLPSRLDPPYAPMPLPPLYRPSTHPRCVERRCRVPSWPRPRRPVYHGSRALPTRFLPTPVASRRRDMLLLSFFPPALPFQGQGFLPQDVSRRGLPWRGAPLVPLPRLINQSRLPYSSPEGRVSDSTCRWEGTQRKHES